MSYFKMSTAGVCDVCGYNLKDDAVSLKIKLH